MRGLVVTFSEAGSGRNIGGPCERACARRVRMGVVGGGGRWAASRLTVFGRETCGACLARAYSVWIAEVLVSTSGVVGSSQRVAVVAVAGS